MTCNKHKTVDAPGLCALCLLNERNELRAEVNLLKQRVPPGNVVRGLAPGERLKWLSVDGSPALTYEAGEDMVEGLIVTFENGQMAEVPWVAVIAKGGVCVAKYNLGQCLSYMPMDQALGPQPGAACDPPE